MSRSKEEAIKFILKVEVVQVCLVFFEREVEEEGITFKGNLAFKDFCVEEGELRGPFFVRVPGFIVGEEVEGVVITGGGVGRWGVVIGEGGVGEEGGVIDGVVEVLSLVGTLVFIN